MKWDEAGARSLRAEVCQIRSTREEMFLLFGSQARAERCIILTPLLAKQLALTLNQVLRQRQERSLSADATPAGRSQASIDAGDIPRPARPLFELLRTRLGAGFGVERSFKMSAASLLADRLILGVRPQLTSSRVLIELCRDLGMPPAHLGEFEARLPEANTVGFGFEGGADGAMHKVYLEFWERLRERVRREPGNRAPALLFLGFKWDAARPGRAAVARYTCHPLLSVRGIVRRLESLYEDPVAKPSFEAARAILELAAGRLARGDSFVYVEAAEEGNPRRSFDLNLYKAGLRVADLEPVLSSLSHAYSIEREALAHILAESARRPFGHLSGGLGRDARDFLTVYYELEGL